MEEKNKKKRLLYTLIGVIVLLASVGGAYAFFSASVSNTGNILGQTQNINSSSLRLSVTKVNFNGIDTNVVPSNDLVPAYFGLDNNNELNVANPSGLDISNVQDMIQNKCVNTSEGFTGCHVYKIAISADQSIAHANLLLGLTVNDHSTSDVSVVDKSQWGYVVFTASQNSSSTGVVGSGTQTAIADGAITNLALNSAGHGGQAAIGDGLVSSPTDNRIDIHNNQKLIGCNSAGLEQEVVYYLLVYVNDTDISQNTSNNGEGDSNYAVGSYSGTLELRALGGKVRANFGPDEATGRLMSRVTVVQANFDTNDDGEIDENDVMYDLGEGLFGNENIDLNSIANIYTVNHTSVPADAIDSWDASEEQNGSVMAWIILSEPDSELIEVGGISNNYNSLNVYAKPLVTWDPNPDPDPNPDIYDLYIGQVGGVQAPSDGTNLFAFFWNVIRMDLSNIDMSNIGEDAFVGTDYLQSVAARASDEEGICSAIFQGYDEDYSRNDVLVNGKTCSSGILMGNVLKPRSTLFGENIDVETIGKVYTVNHVNVPVNAITSWDASTSGDGSIMAWITNDPESSEDSYCEITTYKYNYENSFDDILTKQVHNKAYCDENVPEYYDFYSCSDGDYCEAKRLYTYNLYIGQVGGVKANPDSSNLFRDFYSVTQIDLSNFDASSVTNMSSMFENCYNLATLNLGSSVKSNVTNTSDMFNGCKSVTALNLSSLRMRNVTNYNSMFADCFSLTAITTYEADETKICEAIGNSTITENKAISVNGNRICYGAWIYTS